MGFEPTRGDPIGLAGRRLNRSAKVSMLARRQVSFRPEAMLILGNMSQKELAPRQQVRRRVKTRPRSLSALRPRTPVASMSGSARPPGCLGWRPWTQRPRRRSGGAKKSPVNSRGEEPWNHLVCHPVPGRASLHNLDTCGIRTHAGRPHRLSTPTP